jgi:pimeloyl-ACP methyl ester carboxylesterase
MLLTFSIALRQNMAIALDWQKRIGNQRDWVWRGWQTRYTFMRAERNPEAQRSRPPLILIHGFGAAIEHWRYNLPVLSQERDVYALDLLGFGASRKAATAYTVFLWAQQVYDFWQTFIRQPVVLVGNSIGSLVCYVAAAAYPEMVQGIAMLSLPDVSLRQEMIPKILQPLVTRVENLVASPPLLKCLFRFLRRRGVIRRWARIAYADPSAIDDELVEILAAPAYDEGAAQTFCALFQAVRQPNFAPPAQVVLPRLAVPVLLIWGTQDRMVPPSLAPFFANLNPQIHFVAIDRAGHCPQDECPDQLNPILLNWLDAHFAID